MFRIKFPDRIYGSLEFIKAGVIIPKSAADFTPERKYDAFGAAFDR